MAPVTWRLLINEPACGARNMAADEAILEHVGRGAALPTLRLYAWSPPCLSLGYAQPFADVDMARLRDNGWEVVRRPTGGRAILHTDELTYSVSAAPDEPRLAGSVLESYNRLARALMAALQSLRVPVSIQELSSISNETMPGPVCFEVPSTYEITVNGKKLMGSAQARRKAGVLQHGSLPLSGDLARITRALVFADEHERTAAAGRLLAHATTVESVLGRVVAWDVAARAFVDGFESALNLKLVPGELSPSEQSRAAQLVEARYAHAAWTERV